MHRVNILEKKRLLEGFFNIDQIKLTHEKPNGTMTAPIVRMNMDRGDAVAAVIKLTDTNTLLFVKQFRYATYVRGEGWITEIVAGMLNEGEDPKAAIIREIEEETGYGITHIEFIADFFMSPGGASERIKLYYAETATTQKLHQGGGVEHEDEYIEIQEFTPDEAFAKLTNGEIMDAKSIIGLLWFKLNKS